MVTLFGNFELGRKALQAQQLALDVTGQNISNMNTPGYSRQRAEIATTDPFYNGKILIGTGSEVETVTRMHDRFLDHLYYSNRSERTRYEVLKNNLLTTESVFNGIDEEGITTAIDDFFNAFSELSTNPESIDLRRSATAAGKSLAASINDRVRKIDEHVTYLNESMGPLVGEANDLIDGIRDLNGKIATAEATGNEANDYRDQRNLLIAELSELIEISVYEDEKGRAAVSTSRGYPLVIGEESYHLETSTDAVSGNQDLLLRIGSRTVDLTDDMALAPPDQFASAREWRVHYHVPVNAESLGPLQTTRSDLKKALAAVAALDYAPHLEIETYTWEVLPDGRQTSLVDGLTEEVQATRSLLAEIPER